MYQATLTDGSTYEVATLLTDDYQTAYEAASDMQQMGGSAILTDLTTGQATYFDQCLAGRN